MNVRQKGLFICFAVYAVALIASIIIAKHFVGMHQWAVVSIGHLVATLVVYIASYIYQNSSLYDPFWSVAPAPIAIYIAFWPESGVINYEKIILVLLPVLFWSIRLTYNWASKWEGLIEEDFRYINLKKGSKLRINFVDFFGIHLFPTAQVNLSLLPIYYILSKSSADIHWFLYCASLFALLAVVLETVADKQMKEFAKDPINRGTTMQKGLWKFSRHPNYFGEVSFWFGLFLMTLSLDDYPAWLFISPLSMYLMFALVTCKMMDNRSLEKRSDYADYMQKTSQLFLWPSSK